MTADPLDDVLENAVRWLRAGRLLGYPTETVWGLGADAASERALDRLRNWKGRDEGAPIAILVHDGSDLSELGFALGDGARRLAALFWPGPLTLVLPCEARFARGVARADGAVGVRCSSHPLTTALAQRLAGARVGPITATSLNRSGDAPAPTCEAARAACGEDPDEPLILEAEGFDASGQPASTVVDVTGPAPVVLRWGAISEEVLGPVLQEIQAA